jgi:hypothetical protein
MVSTGRVGRSGQRGATYLAAVLGEEQGAHEVVGADAGGPHEQAERVTLAVGQRDMIVLYPLHGHA